MYQNGNVSRAQLLMDDRANDILYKNLQLAAILRTLRGRESVLSIYKPTHLFRPLQHILVFSNFVIFISPELKFIELNLKALGSNFLAKCQLSVQQLSTISPLSFSEYNKHKKKVKIQKGQTNICTIAFELLTITN